MTTKIKGSPRVRLAVTEELVAGAVQGDSGHCMIAEALKAALPFAKHVSVDIQTIRFSDPSTRARYVYLTPRMAQEALVAFDAGEDVEPFRCELRNPHITTMNPRRGRNPVPAEPLTGEQQRRRESMAYARKVRQGRAGGATPMLEPTTEGKPGPKGGGAPLPVVTGGQPPPAGASYSGKGKVPAGRRRQHGIRALDRGSSLLLKGE
jgi:hypothetical protein